MERPNILMIMADQLSASWLGCCGHRQIRSPHIDRLADEGVVFEAAYCNSPICAPSRASMCAGQYVGRIGAFDNGADFPSSVPTLMHHLRRAGYEVLLSGKMHFVGPDQMHGFERRLTPEIYPSSFVWTPDWTRGTYANPGTSVTQLREAGLCDWSLQLDYDEEVVFRSLEALRDLARRRKQGRPFFLCAGFTHPHDPFIITREWWNLYEHDQVEMPAAPALPLQEMHPFNQWLQIHHMADVSPPTSDEIRSARHAYWGMVSYFDSKVGQLVSEIERLGLGEDTIVIVTSDHGEMLGEHGMWFKRTFFEPSVRVPLVFWAPGRLAGSRRVEQTVSLVDLCPTLLELAELRGWAEVEGRLDGDSFVRLLRNEPCDWKDYAICEYYCEGALQPMRMAVRDRLKYVYVHGEEPLLFDLAADPLEQVNVIEEPAYGEKAASLRSLVHGGWDPEAMRARVLASQLHRRWINEAASLGRPEAWDVQPHFDARQQYVRRFDAQRTNELMRLPRLKEE
jgi:choline-sulfatase